MSRFERFEIKGHVSTENSTATPLGIDGVFTGTLVEILDHGTVFVNVYTDVDSATDGLSIQQSSDGTNWDHNDTYTVLAGAAKNYAINPHSKYLRVVYTNGGTGQSAFRLQTVLKGNSKPSSHRVQDDIRTEDDASLVKAVMCTDSGDGLTLKNLNVQHPLPTDGDSVYEKDIDQTNSTSSGFTGGEVINLFNGCDVTLVNSAATNPKQILVVFKRPVHSSEVCLTTSSGSFSNTKITSTTGEGADAVSTVLVDESADNTDKTFLEPDIAPIRFNKILIEFHTADACSVTCVNVIKVNHTSARLQALKPDGTITDIDATAGGNLKISLEELENGVSSNSNSQLNVTPFHADGTEGVLITGVNYVSGKNGIDSATESMISITESHHEIHSGSHYGLCDYDTAGLNEIMYFTVTTPDTTSWGHLVGTIYSSQGLTIDFYSGASGITGGTPLTPFNNNQNIASTPGLTWLADITSAASSGSKVCGMVAGANRTAGFATRENEIILKQNTTYLFKVTSLAASNYVGYDFGWYNHINAN